MTTMKACRVAFAAAFIFFSMCACPYARQVSILPQIGHTDAVRCVKFSPDGALLATGGDDTNVILWDVRSGRDIKHLRGHKGSVASLAFSPDGLKLLSASEDDSLKLWDLAPGVLARNLADHSKFVKSVEFSPDGKQAFSASLDRTIKVWTLDRNSKPTTYVSLQKGIETLAVHPSGTRFATGGRESDIALWEAGKTKHYSRLYGHNSWVRCLAFSPDGETLVSGSHDKTIMVWRHPRGGPGMTLRGHEGSVESLAFTPDGKQIVSAGGDMTLRVWDLATGHELRRFPLPGTWVHAIAVAPDGKTVAAALDDATARLYDLQTGQELRCFRGGASAATAQAGRLKTLSVAENTAVTSTSEGDVLAWDIAGGCQLNRMRALGALNLGVALSPGADMVATGSSFEPFKFWDVSTGALLHKLDGHLGKETIIGFSRNGTRLVTHNGWYTYYRDIQNRRPGRICPLGPIQELVLSPDGTLAMDKHTKVVDTKTRKVVSRLVGHEGSVSAAAFAGSGRYVLTIGEDKTMRLWLAASGALLATFMDFGDNGWVVITPEGYFNASSAEAVDAVNVTQGLKVGSVAEFWDVFYRPDLVRMKISTGDISGATGGVTFESALRFPAPRQLHLTLTTPNPERAEKVGLAWSAASAGGGVGEVRLFQNGKLILRAPAETANAASRQGAIEAEVVPGMDNVFSLIAFNGSNNIQSLPAKQQFTSALPKAKPTLWILAVGIDQAAPLELGELRNARKDAADFLCEFAGRGIDADGGCPGPGVAASLYQSGVRALPPLFDVKATRAGILQALSDIARRAKPSDTFVCFLSGHGLMDQTGAYSFAPYDVRCDNARCSQFSGQFSSADLMERIKDIKAMTQLVILDTCHAGGFDANRSALYDARITTLAKNMGMHLYASTRAAELASDGLANENSLFTRLLIQGLKSRDADTNQDGKVSIVELGAFVKRNMIAAAPAGLKRGTATGTHPAPDAHATVQVPLITHFGDDAVLAKIQ